MKKSKILIMLGLIGSLSIGQAQWAVTNVNDAIYYPAYFGPYGIFTQAMARMNMAISADLNTVQGTQKVQIAQQNTNLATTDARNRRSVGLAEIAKRDNLERPTIEQCVEISKGAYKSSGMATSLGGGRRSGGGGGTPGNPAIADSAKALVSTAAEQTAVLINMQSHGTCTADQVGVANCSGPGPFQNGDVQSINIKANTKNAKTSLDMNNWSLESDAYQVGEDYIKVATLHDAPRAATKEQLKKNPSYLAMYKATMTKLEAAQNALVDILVYRKANPLSSFAATLWNQESSKYTQIFPGDTPKNPSMFEIINLNVIGDYFMPTETEDPQESIRKRLALSNYIAWHHMQVQENTNILLAHILVQLTTPIHKEQTDSEFTKTANIK